MISFNYIEFDTWFDKYGCELDQDDMSDDEFEEYLCDEYESYCSKYEDTRYEMYRDERLGL